MFSPRGGRGLLSGAARFLCAVVWAIDGLWAAWREEEHFRWQVAAAAVVLSLAWWTRQSPVEFALLIVVCIGVLAAQLINWTCEMLAEMISTDPHPGVRTVKDAAAGMVLVLSIGALGVFALVLMPDLPRMLPFIQSAWRGGQWWVFLHVAALFALGLNAFFYRS